MDENVLMVYTAEQKIYFLHASEQRMLWECPRPVEAAKIADMRCCRIGDTPVIACVLRGRESLNHHLYMKVDYRNQSVSVQEIPNCYRVISRLVWTLEQGLTFLSFEVNGGGLECRITHIDEHGTCVNISEWVDERSIARYSGTHLFINDYNAKPPELWMYNVIGCENTPFAPFDGGKKLEIPCSEFLTPFSGIKLLLPTISWADEKAQRLVINAGDWVGVFDCVQNKILEKYDADTASGAAIIDNKLFIG